MTKKIYSCLETLLGEIEREGGKYGMKLNKLKCEALTINSEDRINYADGSRVPPQKEVKYLGCKLNDRGDNRKEIAKLDPPEE